MDALGIPVRQRPQGEGTLPPSHLHCPPAAAAAFLPHAVLALEVDNQAPPHRTQAGSPRRTTRGQEVEGRLGVCVWVGGGGGGARQEKDEDDAAGALGQDGRSSSGR